MCQCRQPDDGSRSSTATGDCGARSDWSKSRTADPAGSDGGTAALVRGRTGGPGGGGRASSGDCGADSTGGSVFMLKALVVMPIGYFGLYYYPILTVNSASSGPRRTRV